MFSADLGVTPSAANYIEDVFSTWLYTGTGASQTITNGIDLAGKGGLVWIKGRSGATDHALYDTANITGGLAFGFASNTTEAATYRLGGLNAFLSSGFSIGNLARINTNAATYASWTFREQAKFFDVVTYTGTGANRTIAHNLGAVPGCIMIKRADTTAAWAVYHRSLANTQYMVLNTTAAAATGATYWNSTTPTSSVFSLGTSTDVNASGGTYVAYIFAHNAGGFGATGTDNVISCGSFTSGGVNGVNVELGYEPQWVMLVNSEFGGSWNILDSMRGWRNGGTPDTSDDSLIFANTSAAESVLVRGFPYATGFNAINIGSANYIYIAIRRGPMKTPTTGTSVFYPIAQTGDANNTSVGFPPDWTPLKVRNGVGNWFAYDRLRGLNASLSFNLANAESTLSGIIDGWLMNGVDFGSSVGASDQIYVPCFRRAPGFFDVVCYTGTGASATLNHNLGVSPEMVIIKGRSVVSNWETYLSLLGGTGGNGLAINDSGAKSGTPPVSSVTATTFTLNNGVSTSSGQTYVAYLFATVAGVSKVGSYTGTGTTNQINCGFTGGARFVLIKRTDSTGDWYVWDSARGIVAGNDPYLLLNSTAAEVTGTDYVDTYSLGFEISSTAPAAINANGGTFIFLAIA